jgi:hypothetical protein
MRRRRDVRLIYGAKHKRICSRPNNSLSRRSFLVALSRKGPATTGGFWAPHAKYTAAEAAAATTGPETKQRPLCSGTRCLWRCEM